MQIVKLFYDTSVLIRVITFNWGVLSFATKFEVQELMSRVGSSIDFNVVDCFHSTLLSQYEFLELLIASIPQFQVFLFASFPSSAVCSLFSVRLPSLC